MEPSRLTLVKEKRRQSGGISRLKMVLEREGSYLGKPKVSEYEEILRLVQLRTPNNTQVSLRVHKTGWRERRLVVVALWQA